MLRLTAFLLPVDDKEVDFGRVRNVLISIWRDVKEQHVLDDDSKPQKEKKIEICKSSS